jgi:hypothetical protein
MLSMREDGFELDKFILTKDFAFEPDGESIAASVRKEVEPSRGKYFAQVPAYDYLLNATTNFSHVEGSLEYYVDKRNQALAINASVKQNRDAFAVAVTHFSFKTGKYKMTLVTLSETDGESEYQVQVDGRALGTFRNPPDKEDYQEILFDCGVVELKPKTEIQVAFNAVTNGKIPENDETAYSRGRWRGLVLTEVK